MTNAKIALLSATEFELVNGGVTEGPDGQGCTEGPGGLGGLGEPGPTIEIDPTI